MISTATMRPVIVECDLSNIIRYALRYGFNNCFTLHNHRSSQAWMDNFNNLIKVHQPTKIVQRFQVWTSTSLLVDLVGQPTETCIDIHMNHQFLSYADKTAPDHSLTFKLTASDSPKFYRILPTNYVRIERLHAPYATACRDYSDVTNGVFISQHDCIEMCETYALHIYLKMVNPDFAKHEAIPYNDEVLMKALPLLSQYSQATDMRQMPGIAYELYMNSSSFCDKFCSQSDCNETQIAFKAHRMRGINHNRLDPESGIMESNNLTTFEIDLLADYLTILRYEPKYTLIEYLSGLANTVSLWFGASFVSVISVLLALMKFTVIRLHHRNRIEPVGSSWSKWVIWCWDYDLSLDIIVRGVGSTWTVQVVLFWLENRNAIIMHILKCWIKLTMIDNSQLNHVYTHQMSIRSSCVSIQSRVQEIRSDQQSTITMRLIKK